MRSGSWARAAALGLCLGLASCTTFRASNDDEDQWFAEDKAKHFGVSAASGFATTWSARSAGVPAAPAAATGFSITISGGLAKELWDATASDGSGWSWKDLAWDLAGTTVGTWAGTVVPTAQAR